MLSKNVFSEYDPSFIFHSQSSDLPLLNDWIAELINLTENSLPTKVHPTTEQLVQALKRYDVMFREILKQIRIYSEPITRIVAKVWAGVLKLLDFTIKSYHRYVKYTSHLQEQAQFLLRERQGQIVAIKIREEEFELERTVLKARVRMLESETEALRRSQKKLETENAKLRSVVSMYIKSEDLSEGTWGIMKSEDSEFHALDSTPRLDDDAPLPETKFKRKDSVEAGKEQLKRLSRLDIEMDEVLSNVMKEEDRQRLIVSDLMKLLKKNQDVFGTGKHVAGGGWRAGPREVIGAMVDCGIQVDHRDQYGVVQDVTFPFVDDHEILPPEPPSTAKIRGNDVPHQLRRYMNSFPTVLRVPTAAWVSQTIMAIYFDKIRVDDDRKSKGMNPMNMSDHVYSYYLRMLGIESVVDNQIMQLLAACEHYMGRLPRVAYFASQLGLYDKEAPPSMDTRDTGFLMDVYRSLVHQGQLKYMDVPPPLASKRGHGHAVAAASKRSNPKPSGRHDADDEDAMPLYDGLDVTVQVDIHRQAALQIVYDLVGRFLPDGGQDYLMKVRALNATDKGPKYIDVDELVDLMIEPWHSIRQNWEDHAKYLFQLHCNVYKVLSEAQFSNDTGAKNRDALLMQVQKSAAADCSRRSVRFFQQQVKYGDLTQAARTTKSTDKVKKTAEIEKEPVCEAMSKTIFSTVVLTIDPALTEEKIDQMFQDACDWSHQAVLRALEQIWLQCTVETVDGLQHQIYLTQNAIKKRKAFRSAKMSTKTLEPPKAAAEATAGMEDVEIEFYFLNIKTLKTQWVSPYSAKVFRSADIELDCFMSIVLKYDLLARTPLGEYLHVAPKDLWPNADAFMKQIHVAQQRAKRAASTDSADATTSGAVEVVVVAEVQEPRHTSSSSSTRSKKGGKGKSKGGKPAKRKNLQAAAKEEHGEAAQTEILQTEIDFIAEEDEDAADIPEEDIDV